MQGVYTEYPDPRRDEWVMEVLPALKKIPPSDLLKQIKMSRSALFEILAGRSRPHRRNRELLANPETTVPSEYVGVSNALLPSGSFISVRLNGLKASRRNSNAMLSRRRKDLPKLSDSDGRRS
jgi:hypothetical protein